MKSILRPCAVFAFLAGFAVAPLAMAGGSDIRLGFRIPGDSDPDGLMLSGDWALVLEMQVHDAIGIVDENLGRENSNKALIISDPDNCVDMRDWVEPGIPGASFEMGCTGQNEVYTKFNPDPVDWPGMQDMDGSEFLSMIDENLRTALQDDPYSAANIANLNVQYLDNGFGGPPGRAGPVTQGFDSSFVLQERDGFGYGVNDDLPSLFVWADIGTGVVADTDLNPITNAAGGKKFRNLAGLFSGVYFSQFVNKGTTSLVTVLSVDRGMLEPIIKIDFNQDSTGGFAAEDYFLRQFDGGAIETIPLSEPGRPYGQNEAFQEVYASLEPYEVEVFAVMVDGQAAPFIEDLDGNGRINRRDFDMAGYTPLTNLARHKLRAIQVEALEAGLGGSFECPDERVFKEVDLDGELFAFACSTGNARSLVRRPQ